MHRALCLLAGLGVATPSFAQDAATVGAHAGSQDRSHADKSNRRPIIRAASAEELKVSRRHPVSPDVVINLINLMVRTR